MAGDAWLKPGADNSLLFVKIARLAQPQPPPLPAVSRSEKQSQLVNLSDAVAASLR